MALDISGKVISILPEQSGTGKNGVWIRQDFVIETQEQFPKKVCFSAWSDKASMVKTLSIGQMVKASFNPESREFNGKWYTDLRIWKLETAGQPASSSPNNEIPIPEEDFFSGSKQSEPTDDLPF